MSESDRTHTEALVMRAVDDLLTPAEREELDALLDRFPEYGDELADFQRIKDTTDAMTARILADFEREPPRPTPAHRRVVSLGYLALLLGLLVLVVFGGWVFFAEPEIPWWLKAAYGSGGLGLTVLFLHVLRLRLRGRDPYEEIDL